MQPQAYASGRGDRGGVNYIGGALNHTSSYLVLLFWRDSFPRDACPILSEVIFYMGVLPRGGIVVLRTMSSLLKEDMGSLSRIHPDLSFSG